MKWLFIFYKRSHIFHFLHPDSKTISDVFYTEYLTLKDNQPQETKSTKQLLRDPFPLPPILDVVSVYANILLMCITN